MTLRLTAGRSTPPTSALFLLYICATAWCMPDEAAEATRQGWEALSRGEDAAAGEMFREALAHDPSLADAHAGEGAVLVRMSFPERALRALARARELCSTHPSLDLEFARAHFLLKSHAEAARHIDRYRADNPESWEAWEITGLCRYELGDYEGCLQALTHVSLQGRKDREVLYLFYQGLAYWRLGQRENAAPLLGAVSEKYPGTAYGHTARRLIEEPSPPPSEDVWQRQRRRAAEEKWWFLRAGVGGGFDTNPLSLGDTLVDGSLARRGVWFLEGYLSAGARIVRTEDSAWHVEVGHVTRWHDELASFDQDRCRVSTQFEHWIRPWIGFSVAGGATTLEVGPRDTRDTWSAGAGVWLVEGTWTRTRLGYQHVQHRYFLDDLPPAQDLDGELDTIGVEQEAYVPGTSLCLRLGYAHTAQATDGDDHDADLDLVFLQASHPVVWGIRATATTSFTFGDYHHGNSRDAEGSDREDDTWVGTLRLEKPLCDWSTVYLQATIVDGESGVDAFDYDRNTYAAGIEIGF